MAKNDDKLNVSAAAFLQALLTENRLMHRKLAELEKKVDELEGNSLCAAMQIELSTSLMLQTIKCIQGNSDDIEKIIWTLKSYMPSPEERCKFPDSQGMDFWIMLANEAATVFPDDPYFQDYKPSDSEF
ncbi:hypothetical protein [Neisseria chenwenguii]|uniref:hypothetical protein n=1 Tax=Neisseria chenwenguii TaxID=1853278 RepID=UPI000F4FE495|nr:hypothetical protein [Neisseria chenwenguii]ROV56576.1 hypothetical protein EGS38_04150 [Neisseria chenwenguii]